ncbi:MAG: sporulation related protein [Bacteroidetes bacterium]|nr:sporulation related protein [Bacteroidota bacterium]
MSVEGGSVVLADGRGDIIARAGEISCNGNSSFTLHEVAIGINFHWERKESQTFQGSLVLQLRDDNTALAINAIPLEQYLTSVISSEMSAEAPLEFLKAHAITSRSWLVAMLEREQKNVGIPSQRTIQREGELIRWYDREDHDLFDVCADDHCQRYQGITKIVSPAAAEAVEATRGVFLVYDEKVCDARFSKSCGGLTERFESCWEDTPIPYLQCVTDSSHQHPQITDEEQARSWIFSHPDAYCNIHDVNTMQQILPSFDLETTDFFRWKVEYRREELEELIRLKSGIDFGILKSLVPVQRGPSGRIVKLRIEGTNNTLTVGKELEIRRWLSKSHLYSSAFVVDAERDAVGAPLRFVLHGAGWGHGAGFCQIGAAVMAMRGFKAAEIVRHYFRGAELRRLYQ